MTVKIRIPSFLRHLTNRAAIVQVEGSTVRECLQHLIEQFPGIENELLDKKGELLTYHIICVNNRPAALASQVKDGAELSISVVALGGG